MSTPRTPAGLQRWKELVHARIHAWEWPRGSTSTCSADRKSPIIGPHKFILLVFIIIAAIHTVLLVFQTGGIPSEHTAEWDLNQTSHLAPAASFPAIGVQKVPKSDSEHTRDVLPHELRSHIIDLSQVQPRIQMDDSLLSGDLLRDLEKQNFVTNLYFGEKLSGSRLALAKYLWLVRLILPDHLAVEPEFLLSQNALVGRIDEDEDLLPSGWFFDYTEMELNLNFSMVSSSVFASLLERLGRVDISTLIYIDYTLKSKKKHANELFLDCTKTNYAHERKLLVRGRDLASSNVVCINAVALKARSNLEKLRLHLSKQRFVAFLNVQARLDLPGSVPAMLPGFSWRHEWHDSATEIISREELDHFVSVGFHAGKFFQDKVTDRILPCAERVIDMAIFEAQKRNITKMLVSLDLNNQAESSGYRASLLSLFVERSRRFGLSVFHMSGSTRHADNLADSAMGRTVVDLLLMAQADAWIGSGSSSRYFKMAIQDRKRQTGHTSSNNTIEVNCETDLEWTQQGLRDHFGDIPDSRLSYRYS